MLDNYSVILCEGDINSLDYQIYSKVFVDKIVIPCGSNSILKVKEEKMKSHEIVCAITDRDLLTIDEINKLKNDGVFTLKVRAVENILVTDFALDSVCKREKIDNFEEVILNIKKTLYNKYGKRLNKELEINIDENNILEFYSPKKVIDTVALMIGMSKNQYEKVFFELLNEDESLKKTIKERVLYA